MQAEANGPSTGFLLRGRTLTEFNFPGGTSTTPLGINNNDQIVGTYTDSQNVMHGFLVAPVWKHATFLTIDDVAGGGVGTTTLSGINDQGDIVGFFRDNEDNTNALLVQPNQP